MLSDKTSVFLKKKDMSDGKDDIISVFSYATVQFRKKFTLFQAHQFSKVGKHLECGGISDIKPFKPTKTRRFKVCKKPRIIVELLEELAVSSNYQI